MRLTKIGNTDHLNISEEELNEWGLLLDMKLAVDQYHSGSSIDWFLEKLMKHFNEDMKDFLEEVWDNIFIDEYITGGLFIRSK